MRVRSTHPFDTVGGAGSRVEPPPFGYATGYGQETLQGESPFKTVIKGCSSKVLTCELATIRPETVQPVRNRRLVKTGGRLIKHARYYWLLLAESHLTRRLFGSMVQRISALPLPAG
jgi:hypothetical protein